ncbi:MAG: hypothetical protein KC561_21750, partial [Myxococcales bacterium]|nr:hypothetical protein [Myxococcales bacterium]
QRLCREAIDPDNSAESQAAAVEAIFGRQSSVPTEARTQVIDAIVEHAIQSDIPLSASFLRVAEEYRIALPRHAVVHSLRSANDATVWAAARYVKTSGLQVTAELLEALTPPHDLSVQTEVDLVDMLGALGDIDMVQPLRLIASTPGAHTRVQLAVRDAVRSIQARAPAAGTGQLALSQEAISSGGLSLQAAQAGSMTIG